jgi:hypothetical protein
MWMLRKFYGNLPPNDPRILAMTKEQIDLEFEHIVLDAKQKKSGQYYEDEEFEKYDEESDALDRMSTDDSVYVVQPSEDHNDNMSETIQITGDWEVLETQDFESYDNRSD